MPGVHTIPPDQPFVDVLVRGLLEWDADRLADALVLLPSRRACIAVRDAFLRATEGRPLLPPRLQPIGEAMGEELFFDPSLALDLPPAMAATQRLAILTRLVVAQGLTFEQSVRLAGELAGLLDELANEDVSLDALTSIVPAHLAEHWQKTLAFLEIVGRAWPEILHDRQRLDAAEYRNRLLAAAGRKLSQDPAMPVVAAGMNGSIPAVARLLRVVARLPQGHVVLPGLDLALDEKDWRALGASHPQWSLRRLLELMEVHRSQVTLWGHADKPAGDATTARFDLWREVMRPAETSEAWVRGVPLSTSATKNVTMVEHPDLTAEAVDIALRIREALEVPGRRIQLVTSDRNLARRVAAELNRWGVRADDSAGIPLDQSPPGTLLLLAAHMVTEDAAPVRLLSLLKHPLAAGGLPPGELRRHARALERAVLRGPRPTGGLAGLIALVRARAAEDAWRSPVPAEDMLRFLEKLDTDAHDLQALMQQEEAPFADLLEAHLTFVERLAADEAGAPEELWSQEAGRALHGFVGELREAAGDLGVIPCSAYPAILAVLLGQESVRPQRPAHPRVAILGQFESRLSEADLVLIGGLNEGTWPRGAENGPWLNRQMRRELGLPPVEQAIGLAAHDLVMCAMAPEIVLSRAHKDQAGAPTLPSRWISRLKAVLQASGLTASVLPDRSRARWVQGLDLPTAPVWPQAIARPRPSPPPEARPREYWATHLQELVQDPYRHYARRILKLRELDAIDTDPGPAERGQIIHSAVEAFLERFPTGRLPADAEAQFLEIGRALFATYRDEPRIQVVWWPRFREVATWFVATERERRFEAARILTEISGELSLGGASGSPIRIRARADRIEIGHDGTIAIGDYKTGVLPNPKDIRQGTAPQLPIEAAIALAGGFADVEGRQLAGISIWGLHGGDPAGVLVDPTISRQKVAITPEGLGLAARGWLERLVEYIDDPTTCYEAVPRPEIARMGDAYDHLSRVAEWFGNEAARSDAQEVKE